MLFFYSVKMLITDLKVLAILAIILSTGIILHMVGVGVIRVFEPMDRWLSSGNHKQQEKARCFVAAVVVAIITIICIFIAGVSK